MVDAALDQRVAEPVGVIAPITAQDLGAWECDNHQGCALIIAHLPFAQQRGPCHRTLRGVSSSGRLWFARYIGEHPLF